MRNTKLGACVHTYYNSDFKTNASNKSPSSQKAYRSKTPITAPTRASKLPLPTLDAAPLNGAAEGARVGDIGVNIVEFVYAGTVLPLALGDMPLAVDASMYNVEVGVRVVTVR